MAIALAEAFKKPRSIQGVVTQAFRPRVHGLGVIILNQTADQILVVEEQMNKNASQRGCGEISPPMETAKKGILGLGRERQSNTLLGALAEVIDDQTLPIAQTKLRRVQLAESTVIPLSPYVQAAMEILIYEGPSDQTFQPTAHQETKAPRWMNLQEFLQTPSARPWGKAIVEHAKTNGFLDQENLIQCAKQPVLQHVRSIEARYTRREKRPDVDLVRT